MQINFNSISQKICFGTLKRIQHDKIQPSGHGDCFIKSNANDAFTLEKFLEKKNKFTISEYKSINKGELMFLRNDLSKEYKNYVDCIYAAGATMELAFDLKSALDKAYGEDKYIFVSIGRSPSLIAKVFECMGIETKYLPMSNLNEKGGNIDSLFKKESIENYRKILERQGLTKEILKNSDKQVLFYDYTSTGITLAIFEYFMQRAYNLPCSKTEFRSLNEDLETCASSVKNTETYVKRFLEERGGLKFSSIGRLPYMEIAKRTMDDRDLTTHRFREPKLFNFIIMDELNKMGLLKENPANAVAL